ncbi:ABC transporter ATP-binding protein [Candidatus Kaiserbacteria bacterium]|nr:ABC transporter ATP-binding protein [Candidatus Kaiserbacteria bacterium]
MADTALDWDEVPRIQDQTVSYFMRGVRILWDLIVSERKPLLIAATLVILVECMGLSLPLIFKELVDYLPTIKAQGITTYVLELVAFMFVIRTAMLLLRRFVQEPIFLRAIIRLENYWPTVAHEKLLALSIGYHERENTGRKIAKVQKGVEKLVNMLADLFWMLLPALFYLILNAFVILVLDWRLGLIFLVPLIPAVWINLKSYEFFQPVWESWEQKKEESVGLFCQSIINVRTVQSFVSERRESATHGSIREDMARIDLGASMTLQRYFFLMEMVLGLSLIASITIGLYFAYRGWSTVGTVAYITITGNATLQSLWSIIQVYTRMLRQLVAAERMQTLLGEPVDVANEASGVLPPLRGAALAFSNMSLIHRGKDEPIFKSFNLTIDPGKMLALVGKSGSGKSTLVSLLLRVYDPTDGAVTIGGKNIRTVDRDRYRRRFAYVPQEVEIFDGTIRQNIVYAYPDAPEAFIGKAVEAACLGEVVSDSGRFPKGLDTPVGERGVRLSGGERQRVGIARAYVALLSGAEVLVLDEATSSLDSESEQVVQRFIGQLRRERAITIIAIAHRLSTVREADLICVLDAGRIAEMGSHEQLLKHNGLYHRLVALQELGEIRE